VLPDLVNLTFAVLALKDVLGLDVFGLVWGLLPCAFFVLRLMVSRLHSDSSGFHLCRKLLQRHTIKTHVTFSFNQEQNQNRLRLFCKRFLTPRVSFTYLPQVSLGSLFCLCILCFVRLISLVLVLQYLKN